ncbi:hypothetical protein H072_1294 [Dactylellina haptotyla CBS 200.50]|uniref:Uncharacterized protein n=1 Tax=Dactylellina haptotyla (strain CBS 200.50) TaxID=1284197 RepID=S8BZ01_DACHA|nr:hypothetical protein H072_1294 [Dactylellina haptotyla CBS 200.50]
MFWNRLDDYISPAKTPLIRKYIGPHREYIVKALQVSSLALGDQQLFFCIALLCVGFAQFSEISQYHFEIVVDLAWLAYVTFGTTLMITSKLFLDSKNITMKGWRAFFATVKFGMLTVAQLVTFNHYWLQSYGLPANCAFTTEQANGYHSKLLAQMIVAIAALIIVYYYELRTLLNLRMFDYFDYALTKVFLTPWRTYTVVLQNIEKRRPGSGFMFYFFNVIAFLMVPLAEGSVMLLEIWGSTGFTLIRTLMTITCVSRWIFEVRFYSENNGMIGNENEFGFGQILPLLLLLSPLFATIEIFSEKLHKSHTKMVNIPLQDINSPATNTVDGEASTQHSTDASGNSQDSTSTPRPSFEDSEDDKEDLASTASPNPTQDHLTGMPALRKLKKISTFEAILRSTRSSQLGAGSLDPALLAKIPDGWLIDLYENGIIYKFYTGWRGVILAVLLGLATVGSVTGALYGFAF